MAWGATQQLQLQQQQQQQQQRGGGHGGSSSGRWSSTQKVLKNIE
jgi:hypothetical protein